MAMSQKMSAKKIISVENVPVRTMTQREELEEPCKSDIIYCVNCESEGHEDMERRLTLTLEHKIAKTCC